MPRQTQAKGKSRKAAARAEPVTEEQAARARVSLWERALDAAGGDYSKIKYRQSKWAPTLPLGTGSQSTPTTSVVQADGFHGTTSLQYDITAHNTDLLRVIALQCSDFVLFSDVEHVFRKAFPRRKYQYRYLLSGIRFARSNSDFIPKAGEGEMVRLGLFTEFTNQGPTGNSVERHCWAAAYFPETDTHPKTLIHSDAKAAARKEEWNNIYGDKPYRRTIMSAGHKHMGDLVKPAVELFGGPDNGSVNNEQATSIGWITSVATAPTADRAFKIAMDLVDPLCR